MVSVMGERPFDAVTIFGDLGTSLGLEDGEENKLWWERMVRSQVGKDRFLILRALKDGIWKSIGDIRDYVEFQTRTNYKFRDLHKLLVRMSVTPKGWHPSRNQKTPAPSEGWLEKSRDTEYKRIGSEWRIERSVLPLLHFLLMGCPEENRCQWPRVAFSPAGLDPDLPNPGSRLPDRPPEDLPPPIIVRTSPGGDGRCAVPCRRRPTQFAPP